jgi:hypothetical protein
MGLSQFYNPCRRFDKVTWFDLCSFFSSLSMRLSRSHDLDHEFGELTQIVFFISFFNFFSFLSFNIELIKNWVRNLFWYTFYMAIQCEFDILTLVDLCYFLIDFFQFYHSILCWLWITIRKLTNTNGNTDRFFTSVFYDDFYRPNLSIANSICKHRQKYIVDIYWGNPSGIEGIKKPNSTMTCKFL